MIQKEILFVDDEEFQRDVIERVLEKLGCQVEVADSCNKAFEKIIRSAAPVG